VNGPGALTPTAGQCHYLVREPVGNCRLEENALPLEKWAVGLSGASGCPDFVYDWRALLRAEAQQSLASGSEWGVRCSSEVNAGGQPAYFRRFVSGSARNDTRV